MPSEHAAFITDRRNSLVMDIPSAGHKHVSLFLSTATRPILHLSSSPPGFPTHPSRQTLSMAHNSVSGHSLTILTVFRSSKGGEVCRRVAGRGGALNRSGVVISRRPNVEVPRQAAQIPHFGPSPALLLPEDFYLSRVSVGLPSVYRRCSTYDVIKLNSDT